MKLPIYLLVAFIWFAYNAYKKMQKAQATTQPQNIPDADVLDKKEMDSTISEQEERTNKKFQRKYTPPVNNPFPSSMSDSFREEMQADLTDMDFIQAQKIKKIMRKKRLKANRK